MDGVRDERERRMVREMGEGEGERGMQAERDRWERDGAPPVRTKTLLHFHAETHLTCFTSGSSVCSMLRVLISRVAGSTGSGVAMIRTQLRAP